MLQGERDKKQAEEERIDQDRTDFFQEKEFKKDMINLNRQHRRNVDAIIGIKNYTDFARYQALKESGEYEYRDRVGRKI